MSLTYPIAETATEALTQPHGHARTKAAAQDLAGQPVVFHTEWLRPGPERAEEWQASVQAAMNTGSVQIYESEKGRPVIAISFWRMVDESEIAPPPPKPKPQEDHADDLYFRSGRTRKKKPKPIDPNQLDLFRGDGPDQSGYERQDPDNPDIVLTEEGDGTRFGSGAEKEAE